MKKFILSAGLMLAAAVTFAGTPKGETELPAAKTSTQASMKWYPVTYDAAHPSGYIPSGTPVAVTGDQAAAENLDKCEEGSTYDCLRGFITPPSLPTSSSGDGQVTTDDRP